MHTFKLFVGFQFKKKENKKRVNKLKENVELSLLENITFSMVLINGGKNRVMVAIKTPE